MSWASSNCGENGNVPPVDTFSALEGVDWGTGTNLTLNHFFSKIFGFLMFQSKAENWFAKCRCSRTHQAKATEGGNQKKLDLIRKLINWNIIVWSFGKSSSVTFFLLLRNNFVQSKMSSIEINLSIFVVESKAQCGQLSFCCSLF